MHQLAIPQHLQGMDVARIAWRELPSLREPEHLRGPNEARRALTLGGPRATLSAGRTSGATNWCAAWSSFLYLNPPAMALALHRPAREALDRMNSKPTYLSKDGLDKLRDELEVMLTVKRPEVATRIHDAKEHGDLSENAEYEDAKNEQAFVEGRIQTLQALIKNATIIDENHSTDHVQIGSTVTVESGDGEESFTIVGSTEAKPTEGRISNESPVGRALLGKKKGEKVLVKVPAGDFTYKIVGIA
jgi:transcription elongation factor GreA